jgi:hypothetical protein
MRDGLLSRIIDRVVANARAIRGAPEAIAVAGVIAVGMFYFGFQHYRERLADLKERLASQDRLLTEYRAKLSGANPEEAATQIEQLTAALAAAEKHLSAAKNEPIEKRSRDPRSLYDGNTPIAQVQDPKIDLDQKKVKFSSVSAGVNLQAKLYEFQNWKLTCGGTRLYNMVSDGGSREFSYSPLTCKIVGNR